MEDIFFQKKSKLILLALAQGQDKYVTEVSSEVNSTYAHTFNLLRTMEEGGIVKAHKDGRTKYVRLTPMGTKLAGTVLEFEGILSGRSTDKKTAVNRTPTAEKLHRYVNSLTKLKKDLRRGASRKSLGKHARLAGRYRSLTSKLRPKDREGKRLKKEVLRLLEEISSLLAKGEVGR